MENKKTEIKNMLLKLIDKYNLDHNNAEVSWEDNDIDMIIEAPNHLTVSVELDSEYLLKHSLEEDRKYAMKCISRSAYNVDPEDEFNSIWSESFGKHNGFSAFEFVHMLEDDKDFYDKLSDQINSELERKDYELVSTGDVSIFHALPLPDIDGYSFMVVNIATYLQELRFIERLDQENEDYPDKCPIDSMWGSIDVSGVIKDLADFHSEYGLIIAETDAMNPDVVLHTLTRDELKTLSKLKDWELNSHVKLYCQALTPYFNNKCDSNSILCSQAIPSEFSKSVYASNF